jgi:hypothetical protein
VKKVWVCTLADRRGIRLLSVNNDIFSKLKSSEVDQKLNTKYVNLTHSHSFGSRIQVFLPTATSSDTTVTGVTDPDK